MIPIGDENPPRLSPVINITIIASCILVFLWQTSGGTRFFVYTIEYYGLMPAKVLQGEGLYALLTNMFLHGGWSHLLGNMLFLWIFGDNVEDSLGHLRYVAFYLVCGVGASLLWMVTQFAGTTPAVGASGAISGVLGAYFVLYPNAKVRALMGFGYFFRVVRVPAYVMIGLWFLYQLILASVPVNTGVAYWAHVGGFVMGLMLARPFKKKPMQSSDQYYGRI